MSVRTVVALLVLTLALSGVALWTLRRPVPASAMVVPGSRLAAVDVSGVSVIKLRLDGRGEHTIARVITNASGGESGRSSSGDTWTWQPPADAGSVPRAWALDAQRVRALLRLIAEAKVQGAAPPDAEAGLMAKGEDDGQDGPLMVRLEPSGGELRLGRRALAGGVAARFTPGGAGASTPGPAVLIDASILNVLTQPGPSAWRPRTLLGELALRATRITITLPPEPSATGGGAAEAGRTITLRKRGDRWDLLAPVEAPADGQAAQSLAGALERLSVARFINDVGDRGPAVTPQRAGLDAPSLKVSLAGDPGSGSAWETTLVLGGPADGSGQSLFASVDGGKTIVAIDAAQLKPLQLSAEVLAARASAADVQTPDVAGFELSGPRGRVVVERARGADGAAGAWVLRREGAGEARPLNPQEAKLAGAMAGFFTQTAADDVQLLGGPGEARTPVKLTLRSARGEPLAELGVEALGPDGAGLVLVSGQVRRSYKAVAAELRAWLRMVE